MMVRMLEESRVGWERKQHAGQPHRSVLIHAKTRLQSKTERARAREREEKQESE